MQTRKRPLTAWRITTNFQKNLVDGNSNDWNCRSGTGICMVCEDELVHYCSQQRGRPGIHLEQYGKQDLEREYSNRDDVRPALRDLLRGLGFIRCLPTLSNLTVPAFVMIP